MWQHRQLLHLPLQLLRSQPTWATTLEACLPSLAEAHIHTHAHSSSPAGHAATDSDSAAWRQLGEAYAWKILTLELFSLNPSPGRGGHPPSRPTPHQVGAGTHPHDPPLNR